MAPIIQDSADAVKDLVAKLEARVEQLEAKLLHAEGKSPKSSSDELRMIIMGPPGAGKLLWAQ
jgi:adenylate kinase